MVKCRRCKKKVEKYATTFGYCPNCLRELGGNQPKKEEESK